MKTTIELPENTFRRAKIFAAGRGMTLKELFTKALENYLASRTKESSDQQAAPWMAGFGELSHLSEENQYILGLIKEEFEILDSVKNVQRIAF